MKTLNADQLVELLWPDTATLNKALEQFDIASPALCREPGYCRELVAEGWTEPAQINWHGKPAFLITWRVTSDRGFWIDIAQTLNAAAPFSVLVQAGERLAALKQARYIRFLTMRRGLVKLAREFGYQPEAVLMVKPL